MDIQSHNLNALLIGTGEFSFCENAATEAAAASIGYRDYGNITSYEIKPDKQTEDHKGSYRGVVRIDTTAVKQATLDYVLKADEWDFEKLQYLFYGKPSGDFTQAVKAAVAGDALPFATTPNVAGNWYDITIAGVRIKEITACVFTSNAVALVDGVDYVIDKKLGRVRFFNVLSHDVTSSITAPAITAASAAGYRKLLSPLTQVVRTGIGRLICFDQDNTDIVTFEHTGFGCQVYLDGVDAIDGDKFSNLSINVRVTSPLGAVHVRNL